MALRLKTPFRQHSWFWLAKLPRSNREKRCQHGYTVSPAVWPSRPARLTFAIKRPRCCWRRLQIGRPIRWPRSPRELLTIIDEEIQRLPERYRLPVIMCCLGGSSLKEAARQLGWTPGSVKARLERGRERLHARLVRRGLTLSAALAAVEVSRATMSAAVLARLVAPTSSGALAFAASQGGVTGVSASVAALAGRVSMAMVLPKFAMMAALLLTTIVLGAGIAFYAKAPELPAPAQDSLPRSDLSALSKPIQHPPEPFWDQSEVPVEVSGQVLDPHGKPVAGAELYVGYSLRRILRRTMPENPFEVQTRPGPSTRRATTSADGRFRFRFATSELDARVLDDARPAVMAVAAGYGPEWAELGPSAVGDLKLRLVDDLPVGGRVLDADGRPVAGAKLLVHAIYSASADELSRFLAGDRDGWAPRCWKGSLPGNTPTITTDADGRWRCGGLGRDRIAAFALDGPRVPKTLLNVATKSGELASSRFSQIHGPTFDYLTPRVHTIRGAVRDQATREPIAGVTVAIRPGNAMVRTGPEGRFEMLEYSKPVGFGLVVEPEVGQAYFSAQACARVEPGSAESTQDVFLVRGIALSGKVTTDAVAKPPNSAIVEYFPLSSNQNGRGISCSGLVPASTAKVRPDGSYSLVVLPGPGIIGVVASPREDYAVADVLNKEWAELVRQQPRRFPAYDPSELDPSVPIALGFGQAGALPINKYHAIAVINPPDEAQSQVLNLPLRTAHTLQGTVRGTDGEPLSGVQVVGLTVLRDKSELLEGSNFTVTGLNPQGSRDLFFQHPGKKLGKVVTIRGNTQQPLAVTLEPCGAVTGRLVDENGNPVPGAHVIFSENDSIGFAMAKTDQLGRFEMVLFPGQKYGWGDPRPLLKELGTVQVGSGQVRDLGDLVQKKQILRPRIPEPRP